MSRPRYHLNIDAQGADLADLTGQVAALAHAIATEMQHGPMRMGADGCIRVTRDGDCLLRVAVEDRAALAPAIDVDAFLGRAKAFDCWLGDDHDALARAVWEGLSDQYWQRDEEIQGEIKDRHWEPEKFPNEQRVGGSIEDIHRMLYAMGEAEDSLVDADYMPSREVDTESVRRWKKKVLAPAALKAGETPEAPCP